MRSIALYSILLLSSVSVVLAQPYLDPKTNKTTAVSVIDVRMETTRFTFEPEIPTTFVMPIRIINNSATEITLRAFSARFLIPPGAFESPSPDALPDSNGEKEGEASNPFLTADGEQAVNHEAYDLGVASCDSSQSVIPPGGAEQMFCTFEPRLKLQRGWHIFKLLYHWRTLTFAPGDYQIYAVAEFATGPDGFGKYTTSEVFSIKLRPSVWQVVVGVGLGSFLLSLFMAFGRQSTIVPDPPFSLGAILKTIRPIPGQWITGWVSGAIIVFLTYRMRESGFPISLSVNDFYGGVVVGLFSYVGADWLAKKVLGAPAEK